MQKVIHIGEIQDYSEYIDQSVIDYIGDRLTETCESFENFDLIAFDWYDLNATDAAPSQILIYLDRDDIFFICEDEAAFAAASALFVPGETNEQAMYLFFRNLFKGSSRHLEQMEARITALDDDVDDGIEPDLRGRITDMRNEVLRVKKYYEQFEALFEDICDNDNSLISPDCLRYFEILRSRSIRLVSQVLNLREQIAQVRDAYQAQINIEQNDLMKIFTLVTSIFLPLSLIAGWYGMNVLMPEFAWRHGYAFVIGLCLLVFVVWYLFFKKKNWFK